MMSYDCPHPVSRTYRYKKITKPLLERKRRARINQCLDELKDLMVDAHETEGENISKLEKAEILELTVRHLQRSQAARAAGLLPGISTVALSPTTLTTATTITTTTASTTRMTKITNDDTTPESQWQSGFGHCATEACRFLAALPGKAAENLARHLAVGLQNNSKINTSNINPNLSTTLIDLDHSTLIPCPCPISPISQTDMNIPISVNKTDHSSIDVKKTGTFKNTSNVIETNIGSLKDCTRFIDNDQIKLSVIKENRKNSIVKRKTIHSQRINMEEEEEIDVERVDDDDLMWRPW